MLKKLRIRNFQAHKKLNISFDKGVTTITGSSDIGKSAIIRALRFVTRNQPSGDSFIKDGSSKTRVRLHFDEHHVGRTKGTFNTYSLDGQVYSAFGLDVPEPIVKALNISDISFQGQHDAPFWFSESAGEVSRQLNRIVDLDIIDTTLANLNSEKRKSVATVDVVQGRVLELRERVKSLRYIKDMDKELRALEQLNIIVEKITATVASLTVQVQRASTLRTTGDNARSLVSRGQIVTKKGESYIKLTDTIKSLDSLIKQGKQYKRDADRCVPATSRVKELSKLNHKYDTVQARKEQISELVKGALKWLNEIQQKTASVNELTSKLKKIAGQVCPTCGQLIAKP